MRKISVFFCIAMAVSALMPFYASSKRLVKPAALLPGDTVAVVSLASTPDSSYVDAAVRVLSDWGYVPVVGKHALAQFGSFAGTIEQRLADLRWAFDNPNFKAVMSTRGGYGSVQELQLLPRKYFKKHRKWLIGYSDISAVHAAMASDGVMSIHGHMGGYLAQFNGKDSVSGFLRTLLSVGKISYELPDTNALNKPGIAKGILFGGNLSVINDIADTPIDFISKNKKDIILFIEDLDENIHSMSRILYRMKFAGILDNINGLIIGNFKGYDPISDYQTMNDMIYDIVKDLNIPVVFGFPVGHIDDNYPLIQGSNATLQVQNGVVRLSME